MNLPSIFLVFFVLVRLGATSCADQPVVPTEQGRRAWEMLGEYYRNSEGNNAVLDTVVKDALYKLTGTDATLSRVSADFLQALFIQAIADEGNGRAGENKSPYWAETRGSGARAIRKHLAEMLGGVKPTPAAIPLAEWLLVNDRLPASIAISKTIIEETSGPESDAAVLRLLNGGTHWKSVLVMGLSQAGKRGLREDPEAIRRHTLDVRPSVRKAASTALQSLKIDSMAEWTPQRACTPAVKGLLKEIIALLPHPPTTHSKFGSYEINQDFGPRQRKDKFTGWILEEKSGVITSLSWHGVIEKSIKGDNWKTQVSFRELDIKEAVAEIRAAREKKGEHLVELFSSGNPFPFDDAMQTHGISVPEALLAAWLYQKDDETTAASLISPLLEAVDDERWTFELIRDRLGDHLFDSMLDLFSYDRDYPETLRLAEHLGDPRFQGFCYHLQARELAVQLKDRSEDFKTFILPSAAEWKQLAAGYSRAKKVGYLAPRLRLLNCFQFGQPGDVDYRDPQYKSPGIRESEEEEKADMADEVINPFNELVKLKLAPSDLDALIPFLKEESFLPTYSFWRYYHPGRTLHRANWLVAELVNEAAMHTLIDLEQWRDFSKTQRDEEVKKVSAWSKQMVGKSTTEVLSSNLKNAPNADEWYLAANKAAATKDAALLPDLLAGAEKYPRHLGVIARLCFQHGAVGATKSAETWIKSEDTEAQLYAALILRRHGGVKQKGAALAVIKDLMKKFDSRTMLYESIDSILSQKDDSVTVFYCEFLRENESDWAFSAADVASQLLHTGHSAALRLLLDVLQSNSNPRDVEGQWKGLKVNRKHSKGDRTADIIQSLRKNYEYPFYAPDAERATARGELAEWLKQQAALLKAGKPTPELQIVP